MYTEGSPQRCKLYDEAIQAGNRNRPGFPHSLLSRLINASICSPRCRTRSDCADRCSDSTNTLKYSVNRNPIDPAHAKSPTDGWSYIIAGKINSGMQSCSFSFLPRGNREK
jgi:hypothetical protein